MMPYQLFAQDIVQIWELGIHQPLHKRARLMLLARFPELTAESYACLSVGQRDALLYSIRAHTFGSQLVCLVQCPACRERLEFTLNSGDLCFNGDEIMKLQEHTCTLEVDGYTLLARAPNCDDLDELACCTDEAQGRSLLLQRCVVTAQTAEGPVDAADLPDTTLARLEEALHECDPQALIEIAMQCSSCGHHWQLALNIVSYLWTEIAAQARRLLREVHILARIYGWHESEILALSATRRQLYLEMAGDV